MVIGYSFTVPIRGEILFGYNFANNQDGQNYAIKALELRGLNLEQACNEVKMQWSVWRPFDTISMDCSSKYPSDIGNIYYSSRLLYPIINSILFTVAGFNSFIISVIIFFSLTYLFQIRFLLKLNSNFLAKTLAIFTLMSSDYYLNLSLSTAATDLILSLLVLVLFYYIYTDKSVKFLIFLTFCISSLSMLNKQNQIFWIVMALVFLFFSTFSSSAKKIILRIIALELIILNILSIYITEKVWHSISVVQNGKLGLLFDSDLQFKTLISKILNIIVNDTATIVTKNLPTLIIFFALFTFIIFYFAKIFDSKNLNLNLELINIFIISTFLACIVNAMLVGVGNLGLRMYLPLIVISVVPLATLYELMLTKLK
jgi:hypothetical protein